MRGSVGRAARRDPGELKAANITRGTLRRIWHFIRPYRVRLALYLLVIVGASVVGSIPPLLVRDLIDKGISRHDLTVVDALAAGMVGLALAQTTLSLINRWFGSVIGEGLIYDLRVKLFDHVQRMPVAFFTRTQTGSLMSRMTNDVLDAQNAVGTVASILSDVFTLVATLVPMFVLSPAITGLALLVLPPFIVVDRVMAGRIARLSRHGTRFQLAQVDGVGSKDFKHGKKTARLVRHGEQKGTFICPGPVRRGTPDKHKAGAVLGTDGFGPDI